MTLDQGAAKLITLELRERSANQNRIGDRDPSPPASDSEFAHGDPHEGQKGDDSEHVDFVAQINAHCCHDHMRKFVNTVQFGEESESSEGDNDSESVAQEDEDMSDAEEGCVQLDFGAEPENLLVHT